MTIKEMREMLGLTQSAFAKKYNIPFRTIQNWESGDRKPPEYILQLLEEKVLNDNTNCRTSSLPAFNPKKITLPKREDYASSIEWLQAINNFIDEDVVFALDDALICQDLFLGRNNESYIWVYGSDKLAKYNGIIVIGNNLNPNQVCEKFGLKFTNFNRTLIDSIANEKILDMQGITESLSAYYYTHNNSVSDLFIPPYDQKRFDELLLDSIEYYND